MARELRGPHEVYPESETSMNTISSTSGPVVRKSSNNTSHFFDFLTSNDTEVRIDFDDEEDHTVISPNNPNPSDDPSNTLLLKSSLKTEPTSPYYQYRLLCYRVMEGGKNPLNPWNRTVELFTMGLIIANVFLFVLSTVPQIENHFEHGLDAMELASVIYFSVEFLLRFWCCVERRKYKRWGPFWGRVRFVCTFMSIIDLLAVVPYWATLPWQNEAHTMRFVGAVRIFRVFRVFKAEKYTHALQILNAVLMNNREILVVTMIYLLILFIITSTALYLAEKENDPEKYGSIPATMYTTLIMLTAQGIPTGHLSAQGKVVVGITCVFSVGVFALPAALLGWGFEPVGEKFIEKRKEKEREKRKQRKLAAAETDDDLSTVDEILQSSSSSSGSSSSSSSSSSDEDSTGKKASRFQTPYRLPPKHKLTQFAVPTPFNSNVDHTTDTEGADVPHDCPYCHRPLENIHLTRSPKLDEEDL